MPAQDEYVVEILRDFGLVNNDEISRARDAGKMCNEITVDVLVSRSK